MNDKEWTELLEHLITNLLNLGAENFANTVREASSLRITESSGGAVITRENVPKKTYREVGGHTTRFPTPKEAVLLGIEALKVRLEIFPSICDALVRNLNVEPENIVWKAETTEYAFLTDAQEFSISSLVLSDRDKAELKKLIEEISNLIHQS